LEVQSGKIPIVVTEVTGNDMIRVAGICSLQGYLYQFVVKGSNHRTYESIEEWYKEAVEGMSN